MRVLLILGILFMTTNVYAGEFIITYTDEEYKAVESIVDDPEIWLQKAWKGKAFNCIDRAIEEETNLNVKKLTDEEKKQIIKDTKLKTAKEKKAEMEAKIFAPYIE